jgi:peptide/nickel transport system permease protein
MLVLAVSSPWWPDMLRLPVSGMTSVDHAFMSPVGQVLDVSRHLVLPVIALGLASAAGIARYMRGEMLEDIRTARAKGLRESRVLLRHALRNALIPIVSLLVSGMTEQVSLSPAAIARRRFRRHPQAMVGLALLVALGLLALAAPLIAPFDPTETDLLGSRLLGPSGAHWMGTDDLGRDLWSRVLFGARISLLIGFLSVAIAVTLGTAVGAVAGYAGGWVDTVLMRIVDLFLSIPRLILLLTVVAVFPRATVGLIVAVLGLTGWMGVSRLVRGQVLAVREREYVLAARALGYRPLRILTRHILPNVMTPVIVAATLGIGNAILAEAALSYLGFGIQPPTPSWGTIIQSGGDRMLDAWWITTFPGIAIVLTVMALNLVGDGLRDALDPRHTQ